MCRWRSGISACVIGIRAPIQNMANNDKELETDNRSRRRSREKAAVPDLRPDKASKYAVPEAQHKSRNCTRADTARRHLWTDGDR